MQSPAAALSAQLVKQGLASMFQYVINRFYVRIYTYDVCKIKLYVCIHISIYKDVRAHMYLCAHVYTYIYVLHVCLCSFEMYKYEFIGYHTMTHVHTPY